jgi:hypothetical protein
MKFIRSCDWKAPFPCPQFRRKNQYPFLGRASYQWGLFQFQNFKGGQTYRGGGALLIACHNCDCQQPHHVSRCHLTTIMSISQTLYWEWTVHIQTSWAPNTKRRQSQNGVASGGIAAYPGSELSRKVMLFPVESDHLFSLMDYLRPVLQVFANAWYSCALLSWAITDGLGGWNWCTPIVGIYCWHYTEIPK